MGSKLSNSQAAASPAGMSKGISQAFGDDGPEAQARKRKESEDAAAAQASAQTSGDAPSAWDTMKAMSGDTLSGLKDVAMDPNGVWSSIQDAGKKKK